MGLPKRHRPGSSWRFLAHRKEGREFAQEIAMDSDNAGGPTEFDELVVDAWFHIEQMDRRLWWMRIGDLVVNVEVGERGLAKAINWEWDGLDVPTTIPGGSRGSGRWPWRDENRGSRAEG